MNLPPCWNGLESPDLKADANFRKLHHDLVEIEDELQYARRYYNGAVRDYNNRVESFPSNVVAGLAGRGAEPFFQLPASAGTFDKNCRTASR